MTDNFGGGDADQAIAALNTYRESGRVSDLDCGIEGLSRVVAADKGPLGERAERMGILSEAYRLRYLARQERTDFERAIALAEEAIEVGTGAVVGISDFHRHLAAIYQDEYGRSEELAALDAAIGAVETGIAVAVPGSPALMDLRSDLAILKLTRYQQTYDPTDLQQAVEVSDRAIRRAKSPGEPWDVRALGIAANARGMRFARFHDPFDLTLQINALKGALASLAEASDERADILCSLGTAYKNLYLQDREPESLDRSIELLEEAVGAASDTSLRATSLDALANAHAARFGRASDAADLYAASELGEAALALLESDAPSWALVASNLGRSCVDIYELEGDPSRLDQAIALWREAATKQNASNEGKLNVWMNLAEALRHRAAVNNAGADLAEALRYLEDAVEMVDSWHESLPISERLAAEKRRTLLNWRLVGVLLDMGLTRRALEAAETSKSELTRLVLRRLPRPAPPSIPAELLERERILLDELDDMDLSEFGAEVTPETVIYGGGMAITLQEGPLVSLTPRRKWVRAKLNLRRSVADELDRLWHEMRSYGPEAEEYIALRRGAAPQKLHVEKGHSSALATGAIAACNYAVASATPGTAASRRELVLFAVRPDDEAVAAIRTGLGRDDIDDLQSRLHRELIRYDFTGRRGQTWDTPMRKPLREALDHLGNPDRVVVSSLPELGALPWAVALSNSGWRGENEVPVVATVPSLLGDRLAPSARHQGSIVVGNPEADLVYAEREAVAVAEELGVEPLLGPAATRDAVLERLGDASIVHLACHGTFHENSPLASGLQMADGVLTTAAVLRSAPSIDLLILSGCDTGRTKSLLGSEIVSLADAFQRGGVRSLVVSMWRVEDASTSALMTRFHQAVKGGSDLDVALASAMTHVRNEPRWSHPYFWSGFMFMGDPSSRGAVTTRGDHD